MFTEALFTIAKIRKQPKCPSMDEEKVIYKHNGISFSHKERNLAICSNVDGLGGYHAK